jgi:hypothetical protein
MHRITAALIAFGIGLTAAALTACSGGPASRAAGSPAAGAVTGSASKGGETGDRAPGKPTSSHAGKASGGPSRASTGGDPRKAMPSVTPPVVAGVGYGPASSADRARFAPAVEASGGVLASASVQTLTVGGQDVGGVVVYGTKPGLAKSPMFQDQYVVQLINAVTHSSSSPRFVRAKGQVMALSTGSAGAVAGWFQGTKVLLVYRHGRTPDLTGLALAVHAAPPGR